MRPAFELIRSPVSPTWFAPFRDDEARGVALRVVRFLGAVIVDADMRTPMPTMPD